MKETLVIAIIFLFSGLVVGFIYYKIRENILFYRGANPYRRTCKKCLAQQEWMQWYGDELHEGWWEETSQGDNPNCECKKFQTYKSPYGNQK